jgi:TonB family protein
VNTLKRKDLSCSCPARSKRGMLLLTVSLLAMPLFLRGFPLASQTQDQDLAERKLVSRVEPDYPETLKRLYIGGVVRVEALVAPSGAVKSTKLLGGSPILGQSAMKAIKQWKYAPASADETLTVKIEFDSHR